MRTIDNIVHAYTPNSLYRNIILSKRDKNPKRGNGKTIVSDIVPPIIVLFGRDKVDKKPYWSGPTETSGNTSLYIIDISSK